MEFATGTGERDAGHGRRSLPALPYHAKLGSTPADMGANCRCAANYSAPFMLPAAKQAMLSGADWTFSGFAFQGEEIAFGKSVIAHCQAIRTALE
jgi:hypothetical protein